MKDSELLFILAMVYSLGTCAVCHQIGFSPVVGAYIAGVSLSFLPSRVQIYSKISSLRGLGTTLFFFMLGVHVHIDGEIFNHVFSWAVFITFLVSCVQPVLMILMGWVSGLKSRTIVYTALLHNSLGKKALILMGLAERSGVFNRDIYAVLVTVTVMSLAASPALVLFVENVLQFVHPVVGFMDNPSKDEIKREGKVKNRFTDHIMILGFNETGLEIAEFFRELSMDVVVCDLDPVLHEAFLFSYKGTAPKKRHA